jgi:putative spermidine/putrescine transport system substrate-binding protein
MRTIRIAALSAVFGLSLAGTPDGQTLTVVNQGGSSGDAQRVTMFEPFAAKSGVKIVTDVYNQEIAKIRAQIETKNLIWDVVSVHSINEAIGCAENLYEKIDWTKHVDPKPFEAIGGFAPCGAPYLVSPGGLVYDADKYKGDMVPRSWADFWNVQKWPGKRGMVFQPDQTLEPALMADGVPPSEVAKVLTSPGGVDRAFRKLAELKPHIKWWRTGDESIQLILSGEVAMGYAWQGRVNIASRTHNRNLKISWESGYVSALIYMAVMKGSRNKDAAISLIQYSLSAEPQLRFAELLGYPPANTGVLSKLSPEKRADLPGQFLDRGVMQAGDQYISFWLDNGDALRQRFASFTTQ